MTENNSFIYQKISELFKKHSAGGTTPRKLIEAGISREFRISKEECRRLIEELHLEQKEMISRRRVKREEKVEYERASSESYLNELKSSR